MTETISPNSDAILLLTAPLAVRGEVQEGIEPLSTEEYGFLARQLLDMKRKPSDLLNPENTELIHSCGELVDAERLKALLGRKAELSRARAAWRSLGIWCCTRADRDYPKNPESSSERRYAARCLGMRQSEASAERCLFSTGYRIQKQAL